MASSSSSKTIGILENITFCQPVVEDKASHEKETQQLKDEVQRLTAELAAKQALIDASEARYKTFEQKLNNYDQTIGHYIEKSEARIVEKQKQALFDNGCGFLVLSMIVGVIGLLLFGAILSVDTSRSFDASVKPIHQHYNQSHAEVMIHVQALTAKMHQAETYVKEHAFQIVCLLISPHVMTVVYLISKSIKNCLAHCYCGNGKSARRRHNTVVVKNSRAKQDDASSDDSDSD